MVKEFAAYGYVIQDDRGTKIATGPGFELKMVSAPLGGRARLVTQMKLNREKMGTADSEDRKDVGKTMSWPLSRLVSSSNLIRRRVQEQCALRLGGGWMSCSSPHLSAVFCLAGAVIPIGRSLDLG
ncbi:MAG: hypothetical protein QOJ99_1605 [Bryobacterales bacterium]|jgi:hypothetical protein|nr:hypothetical protein [Bryobacterales bacterium]